MANGGASTTGSGNWLNQFLMGGGQGANAYGGLFGQGGNFNMFQTASTIGMGLGAAQAFSSSGFAPSAKVPLSPEGARLEKTYFETAKKQYETGLMPANLASIFIGGIKRKEGQRHRAARGLLSGLAGADVRTGQGVRAALTEGGSRMEGLTAPAQWRTGAREQEFRSGLTNLSNIRNLQLQTPLLKAQAGFAGSMIERMRGARQGQALGDISRYLAMTRYPIPYTMR